MNLISEIFDIVKEAFLYIGNLCARIIGMAYGWFMEQPLLNKLLLGNIILAMFAVILPMVKYWMWETWQGVNSPFAFFMIMISALMFGTIFLPGLISTVARIIINIWFLIDLLITWWTHSITGVEEYYLASGFLLNLIVPLIFIVLSVLIHASES